MGALGNYVANNNNGPDVCSREGNRGRRLLYSLSLTGMYRHTTASNEPVSAIQTTDTAEGTRAANSPKCNFANKKPNAEDFMEVSMAMVRDEVSSNPTALGRKYPTRPPMRWNIKMGICKLRPAARMGSATCATALATNRQVLTTPTTGAKGKIAFTKEGKKRLVAMPMAMGARTT